MVDEQKTRMELYKKQQEEINKYEKLAERDKKEI